MRLGRVIRKWRAMEERDLRSVGKEIGVSAATLMRVEHGYEPSGNTLSAILRWLMEGGNDRRRQD